MSLTNSEIKTMNKYEVVRIGYSNIRVSIHTSIKEATIEAERLNSYTGTSNYIVLEII
jgi:hypothetical protein